MNAVSALMKGDPRVVRRSQTLNKGDAAIPQPAIVSPRYPFFLCAPYNSVCSIEILAPLREQPDETLSAVRPNAPCATVCDNW